MVALMNFYGFITAQISLSIQKCAIFYKIAVQ